MQPALFVYHGGYWFKALSEVKNHIAAVTILKNFEGVKQ